MSLLFAEWMKGGEIRRPREANGTQFVMFLARGLSSVHGKSSTIVERRLHRTTIPARTSPSSIYFGTMDFRSRLARGISTPGSGRALATVR
jgi:hypothetical protein